MTYNVFDGTLNLLNQSISLTWYSIDEFHLFGYQWNVAASALEIMHKLLVDHDVKTEDFLDEPCVDFVQPSSTTQAMMSKPPGHTILVHLTSDSAMLKVVSCCSFLDLGHKFLSS